MTKYGQVRPLIFVFFFTNCGCNWVLIYLRLLLNMAPDKWKHLIVGIVMGIIFPIAGLWLFPGAYVIVALVSLGLIIAVGYGFELFSLITGKGHHEVLDALATIAGGVIGMGAVFGILTLY